MSELCPLEMGTVLDTLRQKAQEDTEHLPFLDGAYLWMRGWRPRPTGKYSLYIMPIGSPATVIAEEGNTETIYVDHLLGLMPVIRVMEPGDEGQIIGREGSNIGITQFVTSVIAFIDGNLLGLVGSGIQVGVPPTCEAQADCYDGFEPESEEDPYLLAARLLCRVQTIPFNRTAS